MPSATYSFVGNPDSVVTGTGSYTIPAGKFAYVTAAAGPSAFFINGTLIFEVYGGAGATSTSVNNNLFFTNGTGGTLVCTIAYDISSSAGGTTIAITNDGVTLTTISTAAVAGSAGKGVLTGISLPTGWSFYSAGSSATGKYTVTGYPAVTARQTGSFWVPAGVTISGGTWCAQLFSA